MVTASALLAGCLAPSDAWAQCAMCKASLEGSNDGIGAVFNRAILVMLAGPYLVMGVFGIVLFRERLHGAVRRLLRRLGRTTGPGRTR
jgi:hypothetical protein